MSPNLPPPTGATPAQLQRAVELMALLFDRDCRVYAHEITIPMSTHGNAVAALFKVRELLADIRRAS